MTAVNKIISNNHVNLTTKFKLSYHPKLKIQYLVQFHFTHVNMQ